AILALRGAGCRCAADVRRADQSRGTGPAAQRPTAAVREASAILALRGTRRRNASALNADDVPVRVVGVRRLLRSGASEQKNRREGTSTAQGGSASATNPLHGHGLLRARRRTTECGGDTRA